MKNDKKHNEKKHKSMISNKLNQAATAVVMTAHAILASFLGGPPMLA